MNSKYLNIANWIYNLILSVVYHFRKPFIKKWKYDINYLVDTRSALDFHIIRHGILNDFISTHLGDFIKKDGIVFDVWANVWLISLPFAKKHVPEGMVFSYEPDTQNYSKLNSNIELNPGIPITPIKMALQDKDDVTSLWFYIRRSIDSDGNNNLGLSSLWDPWIHTKEEIMVEASTIDKQVLKLNLSRLDFIKIDVEWFEYEVLLGWDNSIKQYKPVIQYEFSTILDELLKKQNCLNCFEYMKSIWYTQYRIIDENYFVLLDTFSNTFKDCNVLCFPSEKVPDTIKNFIR